MIYRLFYCRIAEEVYIEGTPDMLHIAICDDDQTDAGRINQLVKAWAVNQQEEIRVACFTSAYLLLDEVSKGVDFDIFLLDILMPEMTGISLGERLQTYLTEPLLIYLTSSEDFYSDAFRLYAFQYLCKPLAQSSLFSALDKARLRCEKRKRALFVLKTAEGVLQIPLRSIVYAELREHIGHLHLTGGGDLPSQYLRTGFDVFTKPLLQEAQFVKTHAAFVANLAFSEKLTPNSLTLTTGAMVPIARAFAAQVRKQYMSYGLREGEEA